MNIPITNDVLKLVGKNANKVENASLLLDKYCEHKNWPNKANHSAPVNSLNRVASLLRRGNPASVNLHKLRREATNTLTDQFLATGHAKETVAMTAARLAIGLSDGIIQNGGISLDRLTGLPTIWGSAIKGACRNAALWKIKETEDPQQKQQFTSLFWKVFGYTEDDLVSIPKFIGEPLSSDLNGDSAGMIYFLPAYPLQDANVEIDITNVHTGKYYSTGKSEDLKNEQPILNYFPTIAKGALFTFLIALSPRGRAHEQAEAVLQYAIQTLQTALTVHGIGAKTGAGYGWFSINDEITQARDTERKLAIKEKIESSKRASTESDPQLFQEFSELNEQASRALVNSFQYDQRTWKKEGKEADEVYRLSIFKYFTEENTTLYLAEKDKQKSKFMNALSNLASHFSQQLP